MAALKTRPNSASVEAFISACEPEQKQEDARTLLSIFERVSGFRPVMWGDSIIGFGAYAYTNTSGTYDWLMTGFSPRKRNLVLYVMQGFANFDDELAKLGKTKHSSSCLYVNKLADINLEQLEVFLALVVKDMRRRYRCHEAEME